MSRKQKNARPTVGAVEQAAGKNYVNGISRNNYTPKPVAGQFKISDFLSPGQENAVGLRHLEKITGMDGREIRRMISRERSNGIPILADNLTGYYLPSCEAERARCVRSMLHRAKEIEQAAQAIAGGEICHTKPASVGQMQAESTAEQEQMEGF